MFGITGKEIMKTKFYSVKEAGEKLGVSRQRVDQYIREKQIAYEWIGGTRIISEQAIKNVKRKPNNHKKGA